MDVDEHRNCPSTQATRNSTITEPYQCWVTFKQCNTQLRNVHVEKVSYYTSPIP